MSVVTEFVEEEDILNRINWDNLLDVYADCESLFGPEAPLLPNPSNSSSDDFNPSWIRELETKLMKDDEAEIDLAPNLGFSSDFLADILADSPLTDSDVSTEKESSNEENNTPSDSCPLGEEMEKKDGNEKERVAADPSLEEVNNSDSEGADDPLSKKQRRQMRNRDAAVRSRERKKMYVRDLELKSRYMEGECRRLDRLLQCFIAENQALRLSLQKGNAFGVISTKQESAVLLLESLLLGSLLWFLGIICLFTLPAMPQSDLVVIPLRNEGGKAPEEAAPKGARSKMFLSSVGRSSVKSRRCKASRTKMKWMSFCRCALVVKRSSCDLCFSSFDFVI